jgi:serine/threonine-protein kinase RIO1
VWSVEYEQFEDFAAVEDFQDLEQFSELVEGMSLLHSQLSYYNMYFNYTVFIIALH